MKRPAILLLLCCISLFACKKNQDTTPQAPLTDTLIHDAAYGSNAARKMDVYLPANRTKNTKLIILIHGGGWNAGDKGDLAFLAEGFRQRGFAVANINYRLSPQSDDNYNMQLSDIDAAVAYLKSKAGAYVCSNSQLYTSGHSAGAHLALAYAYTHNTDGRIKATAGMATPTDLVAGATANFGIVGFTTITPYMGGPLSPATQARYEAASPYYQANAAVPPTILFQGDADIIVPPAQSIALRDKLQSLGVPVRLVMYPGAGHDWWGDAARVKNTLDETADWFNTH